MSHCGTSRGGTPALAGHHAGLSRGAPPRNKGLRYPADPPRVEEIAAVMPEAGERLRRSPARLLVVLWRAGLRIHEALALALTDLEERHEAMLIITQGTEGGARSAWMTGLGAAAAVAVSTDAARRDAFWLVEVPQAGGRGRRAPRPVSCGDSPGETGCAGALPRTSCVTPMRSRWPVRAFRSTSLSVSSATPISASRRFTCRASTTRR